MKLTTTLDAAVEAATAAIVAVPTAAKRIICSLKGNMNTLLMDGKACLSREQIKKLAPEAGITYLGRNSNKEKCICCSPKEAAVNWMHVTFTAADAIQNLWICENCKRAYPSTRGKAAFAAFTAAKK